MDKLLPKQLEVQRQLDAQSKTRTTQDDLEEAWQREQIVQNANAFAARNEREAKHGGVILGEGGVKFDGDKPRMDLLDAGAIEQLAQVLTFGAQKYAAWNWKKGISKSRLLAAAFRHLFAYLRGEDKDRESGLSHVAHAMCCCMFLLGLEHRADLDDRWKEPA